MLRYLPLAILVGCGDPPALPADAAVPGVPGCVPFAECEWLDGYQRRIVGALAGAEEISPGLRLMHRTTVMERDAARTFLLAELA